MKLKYPQLALCSKCKKHGIILFSEQKKSMGFVTKQTGFAIIQTQFDQGLINAEQYRELYQAVSESSLAQRDDITTIQDDIIIMRLVYIHQESLKGARLLEPYFACEDKDPVMIKSNLKDVVKTSLN